MVLPNAPRRRFVFVSARGRDPGPDGPPREWRPDIVHRLTRHLRGLLVALAALVLTAGAVLAARPASVEAPPDAAGDGLTRASEAAGKTVPVRPEAPAVPEARRRRGRGRERTRSRRGGSGSRRGRGRTPPEPRLVRLRGGEGRRPPRGSTTTAPTCPRSPAATKASRRPPRPRARPDRQRRRPQRPARPTAPPRARRAATTRNDPRPPNDEAGAIGAGFVMSRSVRSVSPGCRPSERWRSRSPGGASRSSGTSPGWPGRSR